MNLLKRFIPQLCLLGIICLIAAFSYVKIEFVDANTTINTAPIIIIDAGHGGLTNTIMAILFATVQPHCCGAKS